MSETNTFRWREHLHELLKAHQLFYNIMQSNLDDFDVTIIERTSSALESHHKYEALEGDFDHNLISSIFNNSSDEDAALRADDVLPHLEDIFDYYDAINYIRAFCYQIKNLMYPRLYIDLLITKLSQGTIEDLTKYNYDFRHELVRIEGAFKTFRRRFNYNMSQIVKGGAPELITRIFDALISQRRLDWSIRLFAEMIGTYTIDYEQLLQMKEIIRQSILIGETDNQEIINESIEKRQHYHPSQSMGITFNFHRNEPTQTFACEDIDSDSELELPVGNKKYDMIIDLTHPSAKNAVTYNIAPIIDVRVARSFGSIAPVTSGINPEIISRFKTIHDMTVDQKIYPYVPKITRTSDSINIVGQTNDRGKTVFPITRNLYNRRADLTNVVNIGAGPKLCLKKQSDITNNGLNKIGVKTTRDMQKLSKHYDDRAEELRGICKFDVIAIIEVIISTLDEFLTKTLPTSVKELMTILICDEFVSAVVTKVYLPVLTKHFNHYSGGEVIHVMSESVNAAEVSRIIFQIFVTKCSTLQDIFTRMSRDIDQIGYIFKDQGIKNIKGVILSDLRSVLNTKIDKHLRVGAIEKTAGLNLSLPFGLFALLNCEPQ